MKYINADIYDNVHGERRHAEEGVDRSLMGAVIGYGSRDGGCQVYSGASQLRACAGVRASFWGELVDGEGEEADVVVFTPFSLLCLNQADASLPETGWRLGIGEEKYIDILVVNYCKTM